MYMSVFSHPVEKSKFTETIIIPIESKIVSEKISFTLARKLELV